MDMLMFLFHLFMFCLVISASGDCQYSSCGDNNILIRFPFRFQGQQQPHCGYPGFNLTCTDDSRIVLILPHTGNLYVRNINYLRQQIQVYDPDDCLPNRLQSLNLSGSPFTAILLRSYTFISCPTQNMGSQFIPVECLSNSTHFVSVVLSVNLTNPLPESCNVIRNLSVPVANVRDHLSEDLWLTWYSPDCRQCESQGGMCRFESRHSDQVLCFYDQQPGRESRHGRVYKLSILSAVGPALICVIVLACFVYYGHRRVITSRTVVALSLQTTEDNTRMGLDESTIETYQKLVLGESRRLPGLNDLCCSICLSEYKSKDTIRCIPECTHCFHAHCIDEWLRMNGTCPLCRNTPSPSHVHVVSSTS
ncbi:putative RING-H2 finger protein ATL21A [Lotus japonicus]|uniref:putative RING-H2 finger protein ATL21A n=1 Tax=Lotus japonicus TaxID=34305 RepID=UPI00258CB0D3|nr:putative RING-H2 finger protein ATL21A [Lotus japonicus]